MLKGNGKAKKGQGGTGASRELTDRAYHFAKPLLGQLKEKLDKKQIAYDAIANPTELDRLLFFEKSFPTMIVGFKENLGDPKDSVSMKELGSILTSLIKNNSY